MKKILLFFGLASALILVLVASNSYATGTMGRTGFTMFDSSNLIGATVRNSHGEFVGVVNEVTVDSGGHSFVIVNHWAYDLTGPRSIDTSVPFQELRIFQERTGQKTVVLKMDMEHPDFEPYLNPFQASSRQHGASIYEYYGIQPYWTQGGTAETNGLMELNSINLVGSEVESSCGKVIGIVNEVMVDSAGDAFAVINHGDYDLYGESGVNTPVPLQELRVDQRKAGQYTVAFKADTEHLDFAPYFDPLQTNSRRYEASLYEYYGLQPFWTQSSGLSK